VTGHEGVTDEVACDLRAARVHRDGSVSATAGQSASLSQRRVHTWLSWLKKSQVRRPVEEDEVRRRGEGGRSAASGSRPLE